MSKRQASEPLMKWLDAQIERDGTRAQVERAGQRDPNRAKAGCFAPQAPGLTQTQLAKRLGVSQPVLARMEAGHIKNLQLKTLVRTAAALGARVRIDIEPVRAR